MSAAGPIPAHPRWLLRFRSFQQAGRAGGIIQALFALKMDILASQDVKREDLTKASSQEMPQLDVKGFAMLKYFQKKWQKTGQMTLKLLLHILGGRVRNWKQVKKNFRAVVLFVCLFLCVVLFCFCHESYPFSSFKKRDGSVWTFNLSLGKGASRDLHWA